MRRALENLRKQHLWGDLTEYRQAERTGLELQVKLLDSPVDPPLAKLGKAARLMEDMTSLWLHSRVTDEQWERPSCGGVPPNHD